MIISDHHFVIGQKHTVCEDYAASRHDFAALADGCSVVIGPDNKPIQAHTDIGARLLVRAAFRNSDEKSASMLAQFAVHTADEYRRSLELSRDALSATLVGVRRCGEYFNAFISGDGVIAIRTRRGEWFVYEHYCTPRPWYPRYCLEERDVNRDIESRIRWNRDGTVNDHRLCVDELNPCRIWSEYFDIRDYDTVVALSDGAFSFVDSDMKPAPFEFIKQRLLDIRGMRGRFVLRNLTGILADLRAEGYVHNDDISMIAMHDNGET